MTSSSRRAAKENLIAAVILVSTGFLMLWGKWDASAVRLSPSQQMAFTHWWPLLLIVAGGVLLLSHQTSERRQRRKALLDISMHRETRP